MSKSKKITKHCRSGGFSSFYHEVAKSEVFIGLRPVAKCLLFQLNSLYIPIHREEISVSVVNAAKWIKCNKDTASKAFKELERAGFIDLIEHHLWQQRKARVYRLTFRTFKGREPTDEWKYV